MSSYVGKMEPLEIGMQNDFSFAISLFDPRSTFTLDCVKPHYIEIMKKIPEHEEFFVSFSPLFKNFKNPFLFSVDSPEHETTTCVKDRSILVFQGHDSVKTDTRLNSLFNDFHHFDFLNQYLHQSRLGY